MNIPEGFLFINIINSIISIIIEGFFIYFIFKKIKNIKRRNIPFFIGIIASFVLSGIIISFNYNLQLYYYIVFNILIFITAKILYKKEVYILDFIIIAYIQLILLTMNLPFMFLYMNNILNYSMEVNYLLCSLAAKTFILITLIVFNRVKLNKYYKIFIDLWDRRDDGQIKAVTIRNLSLILLNIGLYITNILLSEIIIKIIDI